MDEFGFVADEDLGFVDDGFGFVEDDTRIDMDAPQPREMSALESGVQGFRDMATFGFGNELSAAAGTVYDKFSDPSSYNEKTWGETYDEELAVQEGANVQAQVQNPNAYTAGEAAGFGATMLLPGAGAVGKGVKTVADKTVRAVGSKPVEAVAGKIADTGLGKTAVDYLGPKINKAFKNTVLRLRLRFLKLL